MKDHTFGNLVNIQKIGWYLILIYFALTAFAYFFFPDLPVDPGLIGVYLIYLITFIKIIVIAEKFRELKLMRFMILSYSLILVIAIAIVIRIIK